MAAGSSTGSASGPTAEVTGRLWLEKGRRGFLGRGRIELLRRIGEQGSIARAARSMGMSYKGAWDAVDAMNNLADRPLVLRTRGGAHGGATRLTEAGRELIRVFTMFQAEHARFLAELSARIGAPAEFARIADRLALQTSARNQFWGRVASVRADDVSAQVALDIGGGDALVAVITRESLEALGLHEGGEACALIKASLVELAAPHTAPQAAPQAATHAAQEDAARPRNRLCGTVSACRQGALSAEVGMVLAGGKTLTASVPPARVRALGLAQGRPACALIEPSHVILAVTA
jgi:molybdate transport system regulatory protein